MIFFFQMNSNSLWKGCPWIISSTRLPSCTCGQWILIFSAAMNNWRTAWNSFSWRRRGLCTSSLASARGVTNSPSSACQDKGKTLVAMETTEGVVFPGGSAYVWAGVWYSVIHMIGNHQKTQYDLRSQSHELRLLSKVIQYVRNIQTNTS